MPRQSRSSVDAERAVDRLVGRQLRRQRLELGLSQSRLADEIGVTFQQIQKYELGSNRVVASRLFDLASVLNVPVAYFFAEVEPEAPADEKADFAPAVGDRPTPRETRRLVNAYYDIENPNLRKKLIDLVRTVADDGS